MPAATDRVDVLPPLQPGRLRAMALALLAHGLLLVALTWGVNWKRQDQSLSAEAELWSALPQQAAPKRTEPPPTPATPRVAAPPPEPAPAQREADIALERSKQQKAKERAQEQANEQRQLALQKQAADKKEADARLRAQREAERQAADKQAAASAASNKKQQQARAQEDARKQEDARRQDNIRRAQGLAGASGDASATGTALRSSGPSDSYGGRIRARVKPNIVFTEDAPGNPTAEVEVRAAPDGTITSRTLVKPSGNKAWDEAVLKAIDKTEVLPRDTDGRVHSPLTVVFRQRD
jgi:colicin import membrane protein